MLALGIDPGSVKVGIAWVHRRESGQPHVFHGHVRSQDPIPGRYAALRAKIHGALKSMPEAPGVVVIERPGFYVLERNDPEIIYQLHGAFAVCVAEIGRCFPMTVIHPLAPEAWKHNFPKEEVARQMSAKYAVDRFSSDDAADALALADFGIGILERAEIKPPIVRAALEAVPGAGEASLVPAAQMLGGTPPVQCRLCGSSFRGKVHLVEQPDGQWAPRTVPHCPNCVRTLANRKPGEVLSHMKRMVGWIEAHYEPGPDGALLPRTDAGGGAANLNQEGAPGV